MKEKEGRRARERNKWKGGKGEGTGEREREEGKREGLARVVGGKKDGDGEEKDWVRGMR